MTNSKFSFNPSESGLFEHLSELRNRIIWVAAAFIAFSLLLFSYTEPVFALLTKPFFDVFPRDSLIGTGPAEAFVLKLKISLFLGALATLPFFTYHVWAFVAPGLYDNEKKMVIPLAFATTVAFLVGVSFAYFLVFPFVFPFFLDQYRSIGVTPNIRISEHLELILQGMIAFGLVFETPVAAFLAGKVGLITHHTLIAWGRYAIVFIFIVSAILTPPDVLSQMLMAVPMLALYGLSILILRFTAKPTQEGSSDDKAAE